MFRRFKNIKIKYLLVQLIITLAYPAARAYTAENNKLLLFTNAITIIGALLLVLGIFYSFFLHGDFDRTSYVFQRGLSKGIVKSYEAFQEDSKQNREESFNYPLWLGILYLVVAAIITFGFF